MSEDDPFLRAILATPEDSAVRLIYADWLEERGDPRADYLRLAVRLAALPVGDEAAPGLWRRMVELRANLPAPWLALLGDYRSTGSNPDPHRAEQAAGVLGRPVRYVDEQGYERDIIAAAAHGLTGALAYVERRSKQRWGYNRSLQQWGYLDIHFHLRVRDRSGREAAWEVPTYNPYFGCDVRFLEWYGDVALVIYREKHRMYAGRFGLDSPAEFKVIEDDWVLDGGQLGYWNDTETSVRRLAIPGLEELPPLSADEAGTWGLLPSKFGYGAAQLRLIRGAWWVDR
jgi:uncharacterized protein (TIGR02996 family)